jgi:hypothetical protein
MHNGAIMPTEVRQRMETGQPRPVVRLAGVLDLDSVAARRASLYADLLGQPGPFVVDLSELTVADRHAATAFAAVLRATSDWPAVEVVLCVPDEATATWAAANLPIRTDLGGALEALKGLGATRRLTMTLEPVLGAARRSRELVTEACARWELPELAGPACIVTTELVNNVVAHARTPMTVWLALHDGTLTVAVQDADPTPPTARGPVAPTAYGGRGLLLIDSVSRRWGTTSSAAGKVVWAVLHPEDEPAEQRV